MTVMHLSEGTTTYTECVRISVAAENEYSGNWGLLLWAEDGTVVAWVSIHDLVMVI